MPTLLLEHTLYRAARPPKPWTPAVLLAGGTLKGLSLDGKDDATTALRTEARGPLGGTRAIPVARQADVQLDVDEPEDGVVRLRLWSLP